MQIRLIHLAILSLALSGCSPATQHWGRLACKSSAEDAGLAELSLVTVAYNSDSLSIKESTQLRGSSLAIIDQTRVEHIKIHDICKYIDSRNWKCGVFQMQEGMLVKNEKNRYSLDKKDHDIQAQLKLCSANHPRAKVRAEQPSTTVRSVLPPLIAPKPTIVVPEVKPQVESNSSLNQASSSPTDFSDKGAVEATKAMNAFLTQLAGQIRANVNYPSSAAEKWEAEVEVTLSEDGKLTSYQLLKSSGHPPWDAAVMKAMSQTTSPAPKSDFKMPKKVIFAFSNREF